MCRPVLVLGAFAVLFVATAYSQQFKIIHPTYRPPPRPRYPTIRFAREAGNESLKPDRDGMYELHTERPGIYDDVKIDPSRRYARSLSTPGRGRASGSSTRGSRGHDTGPTHPGYNRRNAREAGNEPKMGMDSRLFQLHTERPIIYDDIKIDPSRRYTRSLSTPGRGRASGNSRSNRGHDTGPTHPGYNRRNAREAREETDFVRWPSTKDRSPQSTMDVNLDHTVSHAGSVGVHGSDFLDVHPAQHRHIRSLHLPTLVPPFNPKPRWPPSFPMPAPPKRFPIYA